MSSLKRLANKVVNGHEGAVNVWSRPGGDIVVVGGDPNDARDRWSGSPDEWVRALTVTILECSRNRVDQKIKARLAVPQSDSAPNSEGLTSEAKQVQDAARFALEELQKATEGLAEKMF